jgi:hypothetical protein
LSRVFASASPLPNFSTLGPTQEVREIPAVSGKLLPCQPKPIKRRNPSKPRKL